MSVGRDATAQLAAIVRSSHEAIISKDLTGRITGWNRAAERLYGYLPEEVIGRQSSLLAHPDFRASEAAHLAQAAAGEHVETSYTRRVHKSGAVVEVSLSLSPIVDEVGVVFGVASASHHVGALARSEARLKGLLAAAPDAMVCVDADGTITLVNDQVERLFGYAGAELVGQPVEMLIPAPARDVHPGLRRSYMAHPVARVMGGGQLQLFAVRKDGSIFPVDISLSAVDIEGMLTVTAAVRDVSERLDVQAALRESEARFRQLAESVDVAFVLRAIDPPALLYVSPAFEKVYGYNPLTEDEAPETVMRRIHPDDWERVGHEYWDLASRGLPAQSEFRIIRPDGVVRWIRATTAPVADPDGGVTRSVGTAEDITDRKLVDDALRAAHAEAQQANATKNEFLSRMSHELRTPLNAVLGFAQLLELDDLTAEQQDAVQYILQGGRHLRGLIDDVLDIAKIESDRLDVSIEPVLITELLTETVELMGPQASSMGITLCYRPDPGVGAYVRADRRRLRQVMLNLLSNAIKYNVRGGRVDVGCEPSPGSMLDISVQDTGPGIRADDLPRLFTPFDRLGAQTTGIEGTGVGLALSERLMSNMGGSLRASSQVGAGSTFTASIPLAAPPEISETPAAPEVGIDRATPSVPAVTQAIRTVVYIEDNSSNIELMERLLDRRPLWRMLIAREGGAGLELVGRCAPDLLLLDLHLPDMNGLDILQRLRADPRTADLPVVVLSADGNPSQIKRVLAAGAQGYLTKPLAVAEVLALLDAGIQLPADESS